MIVVVDKDGRTSRERAEWQRLQRASKTAR